MTINSIAMSDSLHLKYLITGTRVMRVWPSSAPPRSAALGSRWWRRWRRSTRDMKEADICTRYTAVRCVNTWSTLSGDHHHHHHHEDFYNRPSLFLGSWSTCLRDIWWTACWKISPSSRSSQTETPGRPCFVSLTCSRCRPRNTELNITFTDWSKIDHYLVRYWDITFQVQIWLIMYE